LPLPSCVRQAPKWQEFLRARQERYAERISERYAEVWDLALRLKEDDWKKFETMVNNKVRGRLHEVDTALADCKKAGVCNLVALRGDPPRGAENWEAVDGGFSCARDLVKYIRKSEGDYFSIAFAGYPEGQPDAMETIEGVRKASCSGGSRCGRQGGSHSLPRCCLREGRRDRSAGQLRARDGECLQGDDEYLQGISQEGLRPDGSKRRAATTDAAKALDGSELIGFQKACVETLSPM